MISENIKNLFQFIEYLNSNIDNFKQFDELLGHLRRLDNERNYLKPENNFADKLKYDELQSEIGEKFEIIQGCIINPIISKAKELNVCYLNNQDRFELYGFEPEIHNLKSTFSLEDIEEISLYCIKYIGFRESTNREAYLSLDIFFTDLDRIIKSLVDFFSENEENRFVPSKLKNLEDLTQSSNENQIKDDRFWPLTLFENDLNLDSNFKGFQREIENNGFIGLKSEKEFVKIYKAELALILSSKELSVENLDTKIEVLISGINYLKTYIESYKDGEKYFDSEYKASLNVLYGEKSEQYIKDILYKYNVKGTKLNKGWSYVKNEIPLILNHKTIMEFGFNSGIVNRVDELVENYPNLFISTEKNEIEYLGLQSNKPVIKIKATVLGLFCFLINVIGIDKRGEDESAKVYCKRICEKFNFPYTDRVRQNYSIDINKKLRTDLIEKVLPLIDNEISLNIQKYLDTKHPIKQNLYA